GGRGGIRQTIGDGGRLPRALPREYSGRELAFDQHQSEEPAAGPRGRSPPGLAADRETSQGPRRIAEGDGLQRRTVLAGVSGESETRRRLPLRRNPVDQRSALRGRGSLEDAAGLRPSVQGEVPALRRHSLSGGGVLGGGDRVSKSD